MPTLSAFFPLKSGRAHEAQGPGAPFFALAACATLPKAAPCLWIAEKWHPEQLHPEGVAPFLDPARLIFAHPKDPQETLASAEEALRSGAFGMVVTRITGPLSLLAGRRLQLAAQAGPATGIFLIPEGAGSPAAESRWHCRPHFSSGDSTLHYWQLIKNKSGTLTEWVIHWDEQARGISVVSEAPE